jgi:hypothetical protein
VGFSYEHERENRSQNNQRIYASNHDAEINVGQEPLRLELGFPTEHRASRLHTSNKDGHLFGGFKSKSKYLVSKPSIKLGEA